MQETPQDSLIGQCREAGLRVTVHLKAILELLANSDAPHSVVSSAESSELLASCDTVTLYRLFERLEGIGLVRRIGLHERAAHYVLADSFRHRHFICCQKCGEVKPLDAGCTLGKLDDSVAEQTNYSEIYHELVFYGNCSKCA